MTPEPPKIVSQPSPTNNIEPTVESPKLRRSNRIRKVPDKLNL